MRTLPSVSLKAVLRDAMHALPGVKGPMWAALLPAVLVMLLLSVWHIYAPLEQPLLQQLALLTSPLFCSILCAPFLLGALMVALRHCRHQPISYRLGYTFWSSAGAAIRVLILMELLINLPFWFLFFFIHAWPPIWMFIAISLITLLIYACFAWFLIALPIVGDKRAGALQALTLSYHLTRPIWLKCITLLLFTDGLLFVALLPIALTLSTHYVIWLCLGTFLTLGLLIWLVPYILLLHVVLYLHCTTRSHTPEA